MDKPKIETGGKKTSGKGINKKKGHQQSKNRNFYALQFDVTARNKKRKLSRYIRNFPTDLQAQDLYEKLNYGEVKGHLANLKSHGRHLLAHAIASRFNQEQI